MAGRDFRKAVTRIIHARDVHGAERAIETRSVSEDKSLSRYCLRFGLPCARE